MAKYSSVIHQNALLHEKAQIYLEQELATSGHEDIKSCHGDLFVVLFEHENLSLTELASLCGRSKSTVSVMVEHLQRKGYLIKEKDAQGDARTRKIALTSKGRNLQELFETISSNMQTKLEHALNHDEITLLENLLEKLSTSFS